MKFSIITPTFKRKELLTRAVASLQAQTYKDWEMIIVNDSPYDDSYNDFTATINDPRIRYYRNDNNRGVNYSRNFALKRISADSKWVLFLDDDDYLAPDTLSTFYSLILTHSGTKWFITNRANRGGKPFTKAPKDNTTYRYSLDYLLLRRVQGDATHCIETKLLTQAKITFLENVKQAEEWFFFYQLGLQTTFYYHSHNSTISDGYDVASGLNFRKRGRAEQLETVSILLYEGGLKRLLTHPTFFIYLFIRIIRILIRS